MRGHRHIAPHSAAALDDLLREIICRFGIVLVLLCDQQKSRPDRFVRLLMTALTIQCLSYLAGHSRQLVLADDPSEPPSCQNLAYNRPLHTGWRDRWQPYHCLSRIPNTPLVRRADKTIYSRSLAQSTLRAPNYRHNLARLLFVVAPWSSLATTEIVNTRRSYRYSLARALSSLSSRHSQGPTRTSSSPSPGRWLLLST